MSFAYRLALPIVCFAIGCGGSPAGGAARTEDPIEPEPAGSGADVADLPPLEGPVRVRLSEPTSLVRTGGAAGNLRLACRPGECAMTWTDGSQVLFLRHRFGYVPSTPHSVLENEGGTLACLDLAPLGDDRWAAVVTTLEAGDQASAVLVLDANGEEISRLPLPGAEAGVQHAHLAIAGTRAVVAHDSGGRVVALEIDLAENAVVTGPQDLSGELKSSAEEVVWDGERFWVIWYGWPRHENPQIHLARWGDAPETMELPYVPDAILGCVGGRCLIGGESRERQLTITPIDFERRKAGEAIVLAESIEGDPYGELALLPHSHGHLVVGRRAWTDEVNLVIVDRDGKPLVPVEHVAGLGGRHLARVEGNRYASAWIQPPDEYEPVETDGPAGETLTSLPDYQNLWFLTFEFE